MCTEAVTQARSQWSKPNAAGDHVGLLACSSSQTASLLAAGVIALQATPAMALNQIELQDERQTNKNGLQLIYEVRARPI